MTSPNTSLATIAGHSNKSLQDLSFTPKPFNKERDLREYASLLLKRKWLILTIVVVSTTLAALYALSLPAVYESTATLQLDPQDLALSDSSGTVIRKYHDYDYENTQTQLLSNPQLIRKVVLQLDLPHRPEFLKSSATGGVLTRFRVLFASRPAAPVNSNFAVSTSTDVKDLTPDRITALEPYVAAVLGGLKVQPVEQTTLVSVTMTHAIHNSRCRSWTR